jgi:hypothetical protein
VRALLVAAVTLAACGSSEEPPPEDVVGPFTGPMHLFAVDRIVVPSTADETMLYAADLDGNGMVENKLGLVTASLASTGDLTLDAADMIASGSLFTFIEIQADDLMNDPTVGVRYIGGAASAAVVVGGALVNGVFRSNRTAFTRVPGRALIHLPVFTNADPLVLQLEGLEIDLDADGAGGFDAVIRGGVRQDDARKAAYMGLEQMFVTEPERHLVFQRQVDANRDGVMSEAELDESVVALLVTADIQLFDGDKYAPQKKPTAKDSLSIAFGAHIIPCANGRCITATVKDHCRDRRITADETDIDCGGSCQKCGSGKSCMAPTDCQTNACTGGSCGPASCNDNVRDAYESDIDCGSTCDPCADGLACAADTDCASGRCDNGAATLGVCLPAA